MLTHWSYVFLALTHRFDMKAWMSNHILSILHYVITHPCLNFRCNIINMSLKLWHGLGIASHQFVWWKYLFMHKTNASLTHWVWSKMAHHISDDIFKYIFLNDNVCIAIRISLKFVPEGPIHNIPSLVQKITWRLVGAKPLSESMMVSLLMHVCAIRPQWVNWLLFVKESLNSSPSSQNGRHFTDDILRCIFIIESFVFGLKFARSLFLRVQLTIDQHWFR